MLYTYKTAETPHRTHSYGVVPQYSYLGVYFEEFLSFSAPTNILAESAGRALSGIISKLKTTKNITYDIFETLFNTGVVQIRIIVPEFGDIMIQM